MELYNSVEDSCLVAEANDEPLLSPTNVKLNLDLASHQYYGT